MRCKTCHYSLQNLSEPRCPECGRAFDPNDPTTFIDTEAVRKKFTRHIRFVTISAVLWLLVFSAFLIGFGPLPKMPTVPLAVSILGLLFPTLWWGIIAFVYGKRLQRLKS